MKYLSICSGIEAATVAWHPLGWEAVAFAEIEKFPSAVLKHHWPDVPNLGDMTRFREWPESVFLEADCIIAGTPCQAFSVAGNRRSLEDERGNLTLTFTQIIDHARTIRTSAGRPEAIILWENVPGCLSTKDNAFGCFLSALSGEDVCSVKKWPAAGRVLGEKRRVAWRIIDAQFAGVPQRRRRVFCVSCNAQAVADSRTASPEEILFIGQSLRGNLEKSKEEEPAGTVAAGAGGGATASHWDGAGAHPTLNLNGSGGIAASNQEIFSQRGAGLVSPKVFEHRRWEGKTSEVEAASIQAKAGTGGGNLPIVLEPTWWDGGNTTAALTTKSDDQRMPDKGNFGALIDAIGFSSNMSEPDALEERIPPQKRAGGNAPAVAHCLRAKGDLAHREDADTYVAVPPAVACSIAENQRGELREGAVVTNINNGGGKPGQGYPAIRTTQTVRRLTPVECERLQGFPDNHTRIPWRGKPAEQCPDGSRYKALGNSMAVPVIRWLGQRIQAGSELKI